MSVGSMLLGWRDWHLSPGDAWVGNKSTLDLNAQCGISAGFLYMLNHAQFQFLSFMLHSHV